MKLAPAAASLRFASLALGAACLGLAWRMTDLGAAGVEDIPPPFILVSGLAGIACLLVGILGRYPRPS